MENHLLDTTAKWNLYSGQELSAVGTNHIFKIAISSSSTQIDYSSVLAESEIAKSSRFFKQEDRENYIIRKYALRLLLSKFLGQPPAEIKFHQQANKKPAVAGLQFNTSHTKGGIAIAISEAPIGIDIEYLNPDFEYHDILQQCFNPAELSFIEMGADERLNFYTLWTRKEALLKATGEGLIDNLHEIDSLNPILKWKNAHYNFRSFHIENLILTVAIKPDAKAFKFWEYSYV